jgi:hypothetical protein
MYTQLHLSKGFEVHVTVVSVHTMCTPAERPSGGCEHPVLLSTYTASSSCLKHVETAQVGIFGWEDPLLLTSTGNGRFEKAELTLGGAFIHHDLQAQAFRLLSNVHKREHRRAHGTSDRSTGERHGT